MTAPREPTITGGQLADLPAIVRLHQEAFPGTFTTRLGPPFLTAYYTQVLRARTGLLAVALVDGPVGGFAAGGADAATFYVGLRRARLRLAVGMAPALLRRPGLVLRTAGAAGSTRERATADTAGVAELTSLAVGASLRRSGIATQLVQAFCASSAAAGAHTVSVRTPLRDNDAVLAFYRRLGFVRVQEYVDGPDRVMVRLAKPMPRDAGRGVADEPKA